MAALVSTCGAISPTASGARFGTGADTVADIPFDTLPDRAVIRAVPLPTARTRPTELTLATFMLPDDQATVAPVIGLLF